MAGGGGDGTSVIYRVGEEATAKEGAAMLNLATLETEPVDVGGLQATRWRLQCEHGQTELTEAAGPIAGEPDDVARSVLRDHQNRYGCDCTRLLWDRYQPPPLGAERT